MTAPAQAQDQGNPNPSDSNANAGNPTNRPTDPIELLRQAYQRDMGSGVPASQPVNQPNNPSAPTPQLPRYDPSNPESITALIEAQLSRQVAPLLEAANRMQREQEYAEVKNRFRTDPQIGPFFSQIEQFVDQRVKTSNSPITYEAVQTHVLAVLGQVALLSSANPQSPTQNGNNQGSFPNGAANTVPQNAGNGAGNYANGNAPGGSGQPVTPPHLAPRAQVAGSGSGNPGTSVTLTESEKADARRRGFTDAEYAEIRDASPADFPIIHERIMKAKRAAAGGQ